MVDILYGKVAVEILGEQLKIPLVNYSIGALLPVSLTIHLG